MLCPCIKLGMHIDSSCHCRRTPLGGSGNNHMQSTFRGKYTLLRTFFSAQQQRPKEVPLGQQNNRAGVALVRR